MNIHILGAHNCESQDSRFVSLLIDEVLAIDAGGLTSSLSFLAQQQLKAILLTHHHYDHIRDIPALAMSLALQGETIDIYSTTSVCEILTNYLLDGRIYPRFLELPEGKPTVRLRTIGPFKAESIGGYDVLAVPVQHSETTVGYHVASPDGKSVFYSADTGPGLANCWEHVTPQLLIIEVTMPDRYEELATSTGHLTPSLLRQELTSFKELKGYLPPVVAIHMNPRLEKEIETEVASVARAVNTPINLAYEGMQVQF